MRRFFYTLKQSLLQVARNRAMSLASIFAIMAMLLILSIFFILVININTAAQAIQNDYDSIELFLEDETTREQADEIIDDITGSEGVDEVYYKTKEEALADFRARWGENAYLLDSLTENPLPNSIVIMISDLDTAESVAQQAETYDGVEDVKFYKDTVDKLLSATKFIQIAAIVVMIFLIIVSVVVVSNTIKLTVLNRANEINIMKYIGATNWFVRGPFLGEGIIIGIISAGISVGLSALIYSRLVDVIGDQIFSVLAVPMVPVGFLVFNFAWIFLALGISIGACGSMISMRKFLDK
ncbi:MAG: permease-like cell division protein FtsX [Anaerovoracaceae bacterium]|nr:permease-like cell division protein FtsX [Anaerovoracaceae bacterium]